MTSFKIIELMELFDEDEVTTADKIDRPQKALDREMFQSANERLMRAGGGMLVQPGFGGTRQGYKEDSLSAEVIKEKLPKYFSKSGAEGTGARKILEVNTVKKILNLYQKEKLGRDAIAKVLAEDGTPIPRTNIGRILKDAKEAKLIKTIPQKEMKSSLDKRITPVGEKRKILEVVRPVTNFDRKNPLINAPKNATHKVFYYIPENPETSVIPKKFQGIQYYKSEEAARNALKEKQNLNINQLKYKPQDNAVKSIHRIALKDADEIGDVRELAKMVYGNDNLKNLQNISNDLIRYQQVLLGFKNVKGFDIPKKEILDNILSSFPPENEYGQFASGAIRKAKLQIRDELLKTKGTKLINLRDNVLKLIDTNALNLDEVMGVSATFEKAPGYTELGQVIDKKINRKKGTDIDRPFVKLFEKVIDGEPNPTITYKGKTIDVDDFNKISKNFAKKNKIETPTIVYKPGEKLDASKFIDSFNDLSPEAQKNIQAIAKKGVVLPSKAKPISVIESDITKQLAAFSANPKCRVAFGKKDGGRINYATGPANLSECAKSGRNRLEKVIKGGVKLGNQEGALATQILKAGRSLGSAFTLSGLFGPAAIAFTAAAEAGFVGYDMLTSGKTFKEAVGDSLFNYALGEKTKIDPQKELFKRFSGLGYSDEQLGNFANVLNQTNTLNTILKQDLKVGNLKDQVKALREQPKDTFMSPDDEMLQTDQAIRTEQKLKDESLNLDNLLTNYRSQPPVGLNMEDTILGDMASGKFQDIQQQFKAANILADLEKEKTAQDNLLRFIRGDISKQARADRIAGLEQDYLNLLQERGPELTPFAGGGIAGLSGGIDEGPQVESMNPDSQGLQGLMKRARNT